MSKSIYFFDLDGTLLKTNVMWWIIRLSDPENPLLKITSQEGGDIISGLYKKDKLELKVAGSSYWMPKYIWKRIKDIDKSINIEDITISFEEFNNPVYIKQQADNIKILVNNIKNIDTNKISILTARPNKEINKPILDKLKTELNKIGIKIDKLYFINDSIMTKYDKTMATRKAIVLLEHLTGYKIAINKFVDLPQEKYDIVYFYDDEDQNIKAANNIQLLYENIIANTDDKLAKKIEEIIKTSNTKLIINKIKLK